MLTESEFAAVLARYAAGTSTPAERRLVEQWLAQLGGPGPPQLTAAELQHVRTALWHRLAKAIGAH